jgi:DNA-3-methyladenine glycosylase
LLPAAFFTRGTEIVARELLGKVLVSSVGDTPAGGRIVETEAYLGAHDPGSHAATRGITGRNRVMYGPPGCAYVYFTYGMHHMLNLVTEPEGTAGAVLIRAIEPLLGADAMSVRRRGRTGPDLTNGPAKVAHALGIGLEHNSMPLGGALAAYDDPPPTGRMGTSGRVGLAEGHDLLLRFYLEDNTYVSRGRIGPKPTRRRGSDSRESA